MLRQPRIFDSAYLAFIRRQPCCICGDDTNVEAAHLRVGSIPHGKTYGALQMKSSDIWAVPLCRRHHCEQHAAGNELVWWASRGINPFELSLTYQRERKQ